MPAPRKRTEPDPIAQLADMAGKIPVSNTLTLTRYYRSLDLLLTQVSISTEQRQQMHVLLSLSDSPYRL